MKLILLINGGTTNLRVTALDKSSKAVLAEARADGGVRNTAVDGNNHRLKQLLKTCVEQVLRDTGAGFGDVCRCVAYGMITSNMGLYEIPHLTAPVSVSDLRDGMKTALFEDIAPLPVSFIPGVRCGPRQVKPENCAETDMMRGEEVEAVGLFDLLRPTGAVLFVLPGSHNKFIRMDAEGRILGCMTSVSGELLDAMTHHTILADSVGRGFCTAETYDPGLALAGARECAHSGLGRAAFSGRILDTLGKLAPSQIQSWLLGAVLTEDLRAMQAFTADSVCPTVYVAGKPPLQQAFCDVLGAMSSLCAQPVPASVSARMGTHGALHIAGLL